jgi:hypothetical protein
MATRKKQSGAQRRRAEAAARRRQDQRRRAVLGAAAALAVVAIVVALLATRDRGSNEPDIVGLQRFENLSRDHVATPMTYEQTPPVGGDHNPIWQNCGFYADPVANENAVHSLEHGAVWITYRPALATEQVDRLRALAQRRDHLLVSPFDRLPAPVVASAWERQLRLPSADDPRLEQFVTAFANGGEAPEQGGSCTAGVGTPAR